MEKEVFCPGHEVVIGGDVPRGCWYSQRSCQEPGERLSLGNSGCSAHRAPFSRRGPLGCVLLGEVSAVLAPGMPWRSPALRPAAPSRPGWLWTRRASARRANNSSFSSLFPFSHVWACSPANVKSLLFTYRSTKLQRMGLGDKFSILRHADGSSIFTQNQQQIEMLQEKKNPQKKKPQKRKKKDFV